MTMRGKTAIVGIGELPTRRIPNLRHHTGSRPAPTRAMAS
jgi:hypothetical protein